MLEVQIQRLIRQHSRCVSSRLRHPYSCTSSLCKGKRAHGVHRVPIAFSIAPVYFDIPVRLGLRHMWSSIHFLLFISRVQNSNPAALLTLFLGCRCCLDSESRSVVFWSHAGQTSNFNVSTHNLTINWNEVKGITDSCRPRHYRYMGQGRDAHGAR